MDWNLGVCHRGEEKSHCQGVVHLGGEAGFQSQVPESRRVPREAHAAAHEEEERVSHGWMRKKEVPQLNHMKRHTQKMEQVATE